MIVIKNIFEKSGFYTVDEFGVKNYSLGVISLFAVALFILLTMSLGYITYLAELGAENATVESYRDAVWLMLMASSTVGFGDEYPVTVTGQATVFSMFILGVGILGSLGGIFAQKALGFSDTNIKNRELRQQNDEILAKVASLEEKLDRLLSERNS